MSSISVAPGLSSSFAVSARPEMADLVHEVETAHDSEATTLVPRLTRTAELRRERRVNAGLLAAFTAASITAVYFGELLIFAH